MDDMIPQAARVDEDEDDDTDPPTERVPDAPHWPLHDHQTLPEFASLSSADLSSAPDHPLPSRTEGNDDQRVQPGHVYEAASYAARSLQGALLDGRDDRKEPTGSSTSAVSKAGDVMPSHIAELISAEDEEDGHALAARISRQATAMYRICQRPYWSRLWVFQELKHAKDIMLFCGTCKVRWEVFQEIWDRTKYGQQIALGLDVYAPWLAMRIYAPWLAMRVVTLRAHDTRSAVITLWDLLKETANLECSQRRDRVYAVLSVAQYGHEGIEADYYSSFSMDKLARRILRNKHAYQPPKSLGDAKHECEFLGEILGVGANGAFFYDNCEDDINEPASQPIWHEWLKENEGVLYRFVVRITIPVHSFVDTLRIRGATE